MALADTARLVASLELEDKFTGKANAIVGSVGRLQAGFGQMARGTGQVASGLGRIGLAASAAAATGIAAVVKTSSDFEAAFTNVRKTVAGTNADLDALEKQFRDLANTGPTSFEELSQIGAEAGALGIARKDILNFTDVVRRLAVSTNLSSDQAATALGQLGNILHLRGNDFRDFADSLVALGNAGASTEDQIVEIATRFAAAGNAAGLSKEDILGLSSAVASMGINVEAGGSALSRVFNSVATNIGTSNDKAQAFAKALGLSAKEFRDAWRRDALGTFEDFLRKLNTLDQFQAASLLKKVGITNVRDVNTVRLMAQNVGLLSDQLKISHNAQDALNKESDKFFNTFASQWKQLVNNVRNAAAVIGDELLPVFKDLVKQFTEFLQRPENLAKLKQFGHDLANTIRGIDFKGLIDTAKTGVEIAKTAFSIFNALPGPVKAALIGGVALNRATFGGLSLLTRGAGNLLGGAIKIAFPKLDIFSRGASPANPLWVAQVGGPTGGAPTAAAGGRSLLGTAAKFVLGPAAAVVIGAEIAAAVNKNVINPASNFEDKQFQAVLDSGDVNKILHGLDAIERAQHDPRFAQQLGLIASNIPFIGDALGHVGPKLEEQRQTLLKQLEQMGLTREAAEKLVAQAEATQAKVDEGNRYASTLNGLVRDSRAEQRRTTDEVRSSGNQTANHLRLMQSLERRTGDQTAIVARKDFSPKVAVDVTSNTSVSVNDVVRAVNTYSYAVNTYGAKIGNLPTG